MWVFFLSVLLTFCSPPKPPTVLSSWCFHCLMRSSVFASVVRLVLVRAGMFICSLIVLTFETSIAVPPNASSSQIAVVKWLPTSDLSASALWYQQHHIFTFYVHLSHFSENTRKFNENGSDLAKLLKRFSCELI